MKPSMREFFEKHQPCTIQQVVDALGCTRQAVTHRHGLREIYIYQYRRDPIHKRAVAYYSLGRNPDARKPIKTNIIATQWICGRYPGEICNK